MKINFQRFSFLTLSIFMLGFFALPQFSHAQYNASDLLGQLDENDQPIYTKNGANNGPSNRGFSQPIGIAIDTVNHRLFVGENANKRVLVFNLDNSNNLIDHLPDNVIGQSSFYANISSVTQGGLTSVGGLAYDSTNNRLFVTDPTSHRVLVFDVSTITNGMDASYVLGQANFTSNSSATTQAGMNTPVRATYDSGNNRLFVSEQTNHRVLVFDVSTITNGMNAEYVLGQPDFTTGTTGTTQSKMNLPGSPVLDAGTQRLFVPEFSNNRVTVWDVDPGTIASGSNAINVLGQALFTTATAATTQAGLSGPVDTSFDSATNRLFVSGFNNHRVTVYDVAAITDGENAINVLGQALFTTGTATTTQSATRTPAGQAYDSVNNRLYITERDNNRVIIFDVNAITDGENAVDVLGQLDDNDQPLYTKSGSDDGPNSRGMSAGVRQPAIDFINHRLFLADYNSPNSRVLVFNLDENNNLVDRVADNVLGQPSLTLSNLTTVTQSSTYSPSAVEYDSVRNYLFVAQTDANRVLVFDVNNITDGEDAIYVLGQPDFVTSTAATTQNGLSYVYGLAYDSDRKLLFVSERFNNRVLVFDVSTITNGMNASYVLGQPDFVTSTAATTQSGMYEPSGMDFDPENNRLFVFERSNQRVTVFDLSGGITNGMNASYVLGQPDFVTNGPSTTQNGFNTSIGDVKYDDITGQLFVADSNSRRVVIFNTSPDDITNGANSVAVLGHSDFITNTDNLFTQSGLPNTSGVVYDQINNRLYVTSGRRVSIFNFVRLSTTNPTSATQNTIYSQSLSTSNSQGTVSYAITSGSLPTGLSLNTSTGEISGTPTVEGTYTFTVQATDDNGAIGYFLSQPQEYTLVVNEPRSNTSGSRPTRVRTTTTVPVSTEPIVTTPSVQVVELTTPSTTNYTFTRTLRIRDSGEDVKELQKYLNTHGYPVAITGPGSLGNETTKFGLLTHAAVVKFQLANKLVPDGIVGPLTRAFLK